MNHSRWCDFEKLSEAVSAQLQTDPCSIHGPSHWRRVEQNGLWLATRTGADPFVTRLFAWFHDSKRECDDTDPGHGRRGAEYAINLRGKLFDLEDPSFGVLIYACTWHTDKNLSDEITIGTCWDSDRIDLGRVGIIPSEEFMSTSFGKEIAIAGSFNPCITESPNSTRGYGPNDTFSPFRI